MVRGFVAVTTIVIFLECALGAAAPAPNRAGAEPSRTASERSDLEQWIRANAIPLRTVQPGHGFGDMEPLAKIIGNARIVALGEATHGSSEIFQLKHRMVEFLATRMGFTILAMEVDMPDGYRVNDYILNGKGDSAELLDGLFHTNEILAMIHWMREVNQSGRGKIEFAGFDMTKPQRSKQIVRNFVFRYDPDYLAMVRDAPGSIDPPRHTVFVTETGSFLVKDAAGKTLRFSASIKTRDVTDYAGLWWRVDGMQGGKIDRIAFQDLGGGAPRGTTPWKRYALEVAVPAEAQNIDFGITLAGGGTAWFDGLRVEVDGQPYVKAQGFGLIRDLARIRKGHFRTPQAGYTATFDTRESSGAPGPTLELRRTEPIPPMPVATRGAETWREIVAHMESSRAQYLSRGAPTKDMEWAIQNARVVLQYMDIKQPGNIGREHAMAENVKWILDQNPGTKIVLWAHNGHVGTEDEAGYPKMGQELRATYGDQMVVFGTAFNQGSFEAFDDTSGQLRNFTVPPAASDSFEGKLAATGIPIFALDLGHRPSRGPAARWLKSPHVTRNIGSLYSEERPQRYSTTLVPQKKFDAILFVDRTTAAVSNVPVDRLPAVTCSAATGPALCIDSSDGVSFRLPGNWGIRSSHRWGSQQNTVALSDPQPVQGQTGPSLYYQTGEASVAPGADIQAAMQGLMEQKAADRNDAGLSNYHLLPGSCEARVVGGHPARSCVAEFTNESGTAMAEYLTFVRTTTTLAEVFGFVPVKGLAEYRGRVDAIIDTLKIP